MSQPPADLLRLDLSRLPRGLRVGTSSFSTDDWRGVFYPPGLAPADYLRFYATQLATVEIDATWYATPSRRTVEGWARKTPDGFTFAAKVPRVITHELALEHCAEEWQGFLRAMEPLGEKLGPLLFQFPYVARGKDADEHATGDDFRRRLASFLPELPREGRYVVEVRNEKWIAAPLLDLLRSRGIALAFIDYYTIPRAAELFGGGGARGRPESASPGPSRTPATFLPGAVTADFGYVRFLGNHHEMDRLVERARAEGGREREWGSLLLDRTRETRAWMPVLRGLVERLPEVFVFYNNHYAGFTPGSIETLRALWEEEGLRLGPRH